MVFTTDRHSLTVFDEAELPAGGQATELSLQGYQGCDSAHRTELLWRRPCAGSAPRPGTTGKNHRAFSLSLFLFSARRRIAAATSARQTDYFSQTFSARARMPWNGHASRRKQQSKHTIPASTEAGTVRSYFERSRVLLQKVRANYEKVTF